jgi:hypothetical protein
MTSMEHALASKILRYVVSWATVCCYNRVPQAVYLQTIEVYFANISGDIVLDL